MRYQVTYLDQDNNRLTKLEENMSKDLILSKYNELDYQIIDIEDYREINFKDIFRKKISNKQLELFLNQLSILLKAGYDIKASLEILEDQEENDFLKGVLGQVLINLNYGLNLSKSLEETGYFPKLVINVISAGEESATLGESMDLLADYYKNEEKLKANIKNALYYPAILISITIVIVIMIVAFVLPQYIELYQSFGAQELPWTTRGLMNISLFINRYFILISILIVIGILSIKKLLENQDLKIKRDKFILRLPVIGVFLLSLDLQRYSGIFALMFRAGINFIDLLNMSSSTMKNTYLQYEFEQITSKVENGKSLYKSISNIDIIDKFFVNLVNIGEQSSSLDTTMSLAYDHYLRLNEEKSKKIIAIFEPLVIIILGLIIGFIVISIVMPSFNLINYI